MAAQSDRTIIYLYIIIREVSLSPSLPHEGAFCVVTQQRRKEEEEESAFPTINTRGKRRRRWWERGEKAVYRSQRKRNSTTHRQNRKVCEIFSELDPALRWKALVKSVLRSRNIKHLWVRLCSPISRSPTTTKGARECVRRRREEGRWLWRPWEQVFFLSFHDIPRIPEEGAENE